MARRCALTDKQFQSGNNVSHSKRATRRRFNPNLQSATLYSDALGQSFKLRVTTSTLRTIDHNDGLDSFLLKSSNRNLSEQAKKIKKQIIAKLGDAAKPAAKKAPAKKPAKKTEAA